MTQSEVHWPLILFSVVTYLMLRWYVPTMPDKEQKHFWTLFTIACILLIMTGLVLMYFGHGEEVWMRKN